MTDSRRRAQIIKHTRNQDTKHVESKAQVNEPRRKRYIGGKHEVLDRREGNHQKNSGNQVSYQFRHAGKIYYLLGKSTDQRCKKMFVQAPQGVGPRKFRSKKSPKTEKWAPFLHFFKFGVHYFIQIHQKRILFRAFHAQQGLHFHFFFKFGVHFSFQKNKNITNKLTKWTPNQKLFEFGAQFFEKNSLGHL